MRTEPSRTTPSLRVPLASSQLEAALRLHSRLSSWRLTDAALDILKTSLPNLDPVSCLIKAAAINQLYGTNVYDLTGVARHIADVLSRPTGSDLVEELATVSVGDKQIRYVSFASKFAHFFIDKDRYPIVDSYARIRLGYHLGGVRLGDPPIYADYVAAHRSLIELAGLACSGRELDRYLWLSGLHEAWSRGDNKINGEVRTMFERASGDPTIAQDILHLTVTPDR